MFGSGGLNGGGYNEAPKRAFLYTRVSTAQQAEGYSLEAQSKTLKGYCAYKGIEIVGEFCDSGRSGATIQGRPEFVRMLQEVEERALNGDEPVNYIIVFKLSRFGRNAADVLQTLRFIKSCGCELVATEDSIDSSSSMGSLLVTILAGVAEMERENIKVQSLSGRWEKFNSKDGAGWNGGVAPIGYLLKEGELVIDESSREVIEIIFERFVTQNDSIAGITRYLNISGYKKDLSRKTTKTEEFTTGFVKSIIDNPVYCGLLSYGRRKTEKVQPGSEETHIVRQAEFPIQKGKHEGIISEEMWYLAREKRCRNKNKFPQTPYKSDVVYLLRGLLKCPVCGATLYGGNSGAKKDSQEKYRYYACKHRLLVEGGKCTYKRNLTKGKIEGLVEKILFNLIKEPIFIDALKERINLGTSTEKLEEELVVLEKHLLQLTRAKGMLEKESESLPIDAPNYEQKFSEITQRVYKKIDEISLVEKDIDTLKARIRSVHNDVVTAEGIYSILGDFEKLWGKIDDLEKRNLLQLLIESIELWDEMPPNLCEIKSVKLRFPLKYGCPESDTIILDSESSVETVTLLSKIKSSFEDECVDIDVDLSKLEAPKYYPSVSYNKIKSFVWERYGVKVSSLNIAQIKRKMGIIERECYNKCKGENVRQPKCTKEKEGYITEAFYHFGLL